MKSNHRRHVVRAAGYALALLGLAGATSPHLFAQSTPLPPKGADVHEIYDRLLPQIEKIPVFDHHSHPGFADDSDVDAMVSPPGSVPFRLRDTNPELVDAAKALFDYPYTDFAPEHAKWLSDKLGEMRRQQGVHYFSNILDRLNIETCLANRVAMPDYLDPKRFRWVFFVDSFLFPFDNSRLEKRDSDEAIYLPLQEKVLHRYMTQIGAPALPDDLAGYTAMIRRILEDNQKHGGVAIKFEAAYFRTLYFTDPNRDIAERIYRKYRAGGVPTNEEYLVFQDYIFRRLLDDALALHLPVHFHSAVGVGDYFPLGESNGMKLENVIRDPRYADITFVLLHGVFPYEREAIWLAAMKNVYLDSSLMEVIMYPSELKKSLKQWLEIFPDKIVYGSDAFPFSDALGADVTFWLGVRTARTSLAAALAEMVGDGEVTESVALQLAHGYLHDNAAKLYPPQR